MDITKEEYGKLGEKTINKYILKNNKGMEVNIIEYGARITKISVPDKDNKFENVVFGFDTLEEYIADQSFQGAICGRVAGRIRNAEFYLNNEKYQLTKNDGINHLHGGEKNFSNVVWTGKIGRTYDTVFVELKYHSKDGEEGYPGNFDISVKYTLDNNDTLTIDYRGKTDKPTIANLTNHAYFNLSGDFTEDIHKHSLEVDSLKYCELDDQSIPTGRFVEMDRIGDHPFNFNIEEDIEKCFEYTPVEIASLFYFHFENGMDHPFLLTGDRAIKLSHYESGRNLSIETDKDAVVIYTSGNSPEPQRFKTICLEVQNLPDAINYEYFGDITITPEKEYKSTSRYTFGIIKPMGRLIFSPFIGF